MTSQRLSYASRIAYCKNPVAKKLLALMEKKQSNLALSADVTSAAELLALADTLGPEICLLKTHIDIIDDFTPTLITELQKLSRQHDFLIFEDRKFADIGNTVKQQYQGGIYRIVDWADMINAHSLPGPGIVSGLAEIGAPKQRGLLLLAEMSSANNLVNSDYTQNTIRIAKEFPEFVFGFIAQQRLSTNPQWIYMTPGIQFIKGNDTLGQQYTTPTQAILKQNSDIIIVGRGILHASDPTTEATKYRIAGWEAYREGLNKVIA
jgi:uridine monophosphate synthetase